MIYTQGCSCVFINAESKPSEPDQVLSASGEVGSSCSFAQKAPLPALPGRKGKGGNRKRKEEA